MRRLHAIAIASTRARSSIRVVHRLGATHRARIAQAFDGVCAFARTAKNCGDFRRDGSARGCRVTIVAASRVTSACAMRTGDARGCGADGVVATIAIAAGRDDCLQACRSGEGRRGTPSSRAASASCDLSRRHFRVALAATRCPSARRLGAITRTRGAVRGGRRGARASPLSARAGVFAGQVKRFQRTHARVRTRCAREARVGVLDRRTVVSATPLELARRRVAVGRVRSPSSRRRTARSPASTTAAAVASAARGRKKFAHFRAIGLVRREIGGRRGPEFFLPVQVVGIVRDTLRARRARVEKTGRKKRERAESRATLGFQRRRTKRASNASMRARVFRTRARRRRRGVPGERSEKKIGRVVDSHKKRD